MTVRTIEDRLGQVDRSAGPSACWPWTGTITRHGYGQTSIGPKGSARSIRAHRFVWEQVHGPIPEGLQVCHRCDNRRCCNLSHLFLGTAADNQRDKRDKGRAAKGERNGASKLTDAQVREIRRLPRMTQSALARRFGVSSPVIARIRSGEAWRHVR